MEYSNTHPSFVRSEDSNVPERSFHGVDPIFGRLDRTLTSDDEHFYEKRLKQKKISKEITNTNLRKTKNKDYKFHILYLLYICIIELKCVVKVQFWYKNNNLFTRHASLFSWVFSGLFGFPKNILKINEEGTPIIKKHFCHLGAE